MAAVLNIILAMMIFGSIGIVVRFIDLPAQEVVFVRALVSGIVLLMIKVLFLRSKVTYKKKDVLKMLVSGAALGLNWVFLFKAYKYTSIVNATLSYYMAPIFAILIAALFLMEKITVKKVISMIVATSGLLLIVSQKSQEAVVTQNSLIGISFGLLAAVLYAIVVTLNKTVKDVSGFDKTLIQILTSIMILLPVVMTRKVLYVPSLYMICLFLIIGIVHTCIPYLLYFSSIKKVSIQKAAILSYVDPISAVLFSSLFLHEALSVYHLLGGLLILFSAVLSFDTKV